MNMHSARAAFGATRWKTILGIPVASIELGRRHRLLPRLVRRAPLHQGQLPQRAQRQHRLYATRFRRSPRRFSHPARRRRRRYRREAALRRSRSRHNLNGTDFIPAFLQRDVTAADRRLARREARQRRGGSRRTFGSSRRSTNSSSSMTAISPRPRSRRSSSASRRCGPTCCWSPWACRARNCGSRATSPAPLHAADRRRRAARFHERHGAAGAAVDAPSAARMAVSADHRARPALAPLRLRQPGLPGARAAPEIHGRGAVPEQTIEQPVRA